MQNQKRLVSTSLYDSRNDGKPGKVILECQDGRILAHKCVLKAGSDYFWAMFSHDIVENETNMVDIPDATSQAMNVVIKFIYGQDISEISESLMREVLIIADKLQMEDLFDKYWIPFCTKITLDNFQTVWRLAEIIADHKTMENVETFVSKHAKPIAEADVVSDIAMALLHAKNPRIKILAFLFRSGKCKHLVKKENHKRWITGRENELQTGSWVPIDSFCFKFVNHKFVAFDQTTFETHCQRTILSSQFSMSSDIAIETANRTEVYFKTETSYARFNIDRKRWDLVGFVERYVHDCTSMLLTTSDGKFVFDVDELRIKIVDPESMTWTMKEKLPGDWRNVRCRNLCKSRAGKLIFYQKEPSCLLVYDVLRDDWSVVPAPDIEGNVFMYVCYESDCLIFEQTHSHYKICSLQTMVNVASLKFSQYVNDYIHFDVIIDDF